MNTHSSLSAEFPPTHQLDVQPSHQVKCPAPAGQTPPVPQAHPAASPVASTFLPSPVECASPTTGTLYHPATPMPTGAVFHNTPASPIPTFAVNNSINSISNNEFQNSPILCGPTPTSTPVQPSTAFTHSPQPTTPMEFASETYSAPTNSPAPHLSTIKGNITSFVGKVTHNPDKQQAGNAMIANRKEEKAVFFDQQASEWEIKGNTAKAHKYREKAARCRQMALAKLHEPLTTPTNKTSVKMDKAARLDAKAQDYERKGDDARAVRTHNKARQLRQKYGLSQPIGNTTPPMLVIHPVVAPTL